MPHLADDQRKKISQTLKEAYLSGRRKKYWLGKKFSEEHRRKMSLKRKNENNPNWKGENVGYSTLHTWVKRHRGEPQICYGCGEQMKTLHWANISGKYLRNLDDFVSLCVSCHKNHDL